MSDAPDHLLHIFREAVLSDVRADQPALTLRQLAVVLTVYRTDELPTVRGLAKHLNIRDPVVTRALDRLRDLNLARRVIDRLDRRSVNVVRTEAGAAMMRRLTGAMAGRQAM